LAHRKSTLFNDPIYGFIAIETDLILQLINHPYFQRLRRISQMGLSSLVYPGAHHTRFEHAIGAMHVMQKAIEVLITKGVQISPQEREAMQIAILLHDIGHGPFSHATEKTLLHGIHHETISLRVISLLNQIFNGKLDLAYQIFTNQYPRKFMYQLVSGQVDVDRLDYLKRDSFYTGVTEGNINTSRILAMMNVINEQLVFEVKGIHSLEKFLLARRLMYWQVYLHKTSLAAEVLLVKTLERFQYLIELGAMEVEEEHALFSLLNKKQSDQNQLSEEVLLHYLNLDDSDIIQLLKSWEKHIDHVLASLSSQLLHRKLPKIKIRDKAYNHEEIKDKTISLDATKAGLGVGEYFVFSGSISNQTYLSDESRLLILDKNDNVFPLAEAIQYLDFKQFSTPVTKYYLCYPKQINSP
jgi:HD superfamily phosphohydrolase|tara:strand:- start:494 stop:1729 length:1236 start_codon:yes stop_codon:yes gene_type:complete